MEKVFGTTRQQFFGLGLLVAYFSKLQLLSFAIEGLPGTSMECIESVLEGRLQPQHFTVDEMFVLSQYWQVHWSLKLLFFLHSLQVEGNS
jgi:hypothetical protein